MSSITIRPATLRDATDLAAFVDMAGEGLASFFWSEMAEPGQSPFEVGRARAMRDKGSFSWRNAFLAELEGNVAGALVGYTIPEADPAEIAQMADVVRPLGELEAEAPGYWYVNVLATYPEWRGHGIGTALLGKADQIGKNAGSVGMAIIVASENTGAVRLYERVGYREVTRRTVSRYPGSRLGGDWVLLTKPHS